MKLLFVCNENTCRSVMAAAIAQFLLGDDYECTSAGINLNEKEHVRQRSY
jgi:protein-tyrosine-phosphatase